MADDIHVKIKGLEEFQRKMEQAVLALRGPKIVTAIQTATLLIQRSAKINVPVDTGRLRASIIPTVDAEGAVVSGKYSPTYATYTPLGAASAVVSGIVGTNIVYGPYVERPGPVRASGRRPWLEPALMENQSRIEAFLAVAIVEAMKE